MASDTIVDCAAQFGGQDAADAILPQFRRLKAAMKGFGVRGLPFDDLTFILRVDGEVHVFGGSGLDAVNIEQRGKSLVVDVCVQAQDYETSGDVIANAIDNCSEYLSAKINGRRWKIDYDALHSSLSELLNRFREMA